ncbi:hypothetical protein [Burkholderia gladioli]|uniref:hypothetical protein n=1 Tax=Burkholderia gladioli TaxID=28095 RepID=UPI0022D4FC17|nr:hypothetical protein [Burkholderia gladioli]MDA0576329.1 hypothetical protein [Burkholderia gladioli]MDA0604409.1 hypothetical protein [Burkholderia gladioli]
MTNVIEFKKKPEPAPVEPVEIGPEHYTPEHYRLADLVRYEYSPETWADRDGYAYQNTLEQHAQLVAFFAAFSFRYDDYAHSAFLAWQTLQDEFASHVHMRLENAGTWYVVRNKLDSDLVAYVEAVALQDKDAIQRYRHVAQKALEKAKSEHEEAVNKVQHTDIQLPAEATMFERGVQNFRWHSPFSYSFPAFERMSSGEYRNEAHGMFVTYAYVCGWSYADISRDKLRLDEVASICIGTLGYYFYQMTATGDGRWSKAHAAKTFPGCSDKLLRYLSACYGRRVESARKLRDAVWPELQNWARRNPFDRSLFGRRS